MEKTFKARFTRGILEPLEQLTLNEGDEVMVTIISRPEAGSGSDQKGEPKESLAEQMAAHESFRRGTEEGLRQFEEGNYSRLSDVKRRLGDV